MEQKNRKTILTGVTIGVSVASAVGMMYLFVSQIMKANSGNQTYEKYYKTTLGEHDIYVRLKSENDTESILFSQKYIELRTNGFIDKDDSSFFIDDDSVISHNGDLRYYDYENVNNSNGFFPSNLQNGVTQITIRSLSSNGNNISAETNLTYYNQYNGTPLISSGFFKNPPTDISSRPDHFEIAYRHEMGGEVTYYHMTTASIDNEEKLTLLHAKELADIYERPTDKTQYYRFLDDFAFTPAPPGYFYPYAGLSKSRMELIDELPTDVRELLNEPEHIDLPGKGTIVGRSAFVLRSTIYSGVLYSARMDKYV